MLVGADLSSAARSVPLKAVMAPGSDHKLGGIFGYLALSHEPLAALTRAGAVNVFVAVAPVKRRKLWLHQNTLPPLMPEAPSASP